MFCKTGTVAEVLLPAPLDALHASRKAQQEHNVERMPCHIASASSVLEETQRERNVHNRCMKMKYLKICLIYSYFMYIYFFQKTQLKTKPKGKNPRRLPCMKI